MSRFLPYTKAIVAALSGVVAVAIAIIQEDDPATIPGLAAGIQGVVTAVLVYFFPNVPLPVKPREVAPNDPTPRHEDDWRRV